MYYFSKAEVRFLLGSLRAAYEKSGNWPADAAEISAEEWEAYAKGQPPDGMQLGANDNGRPAWVPIPPPDLETLAARKRAAIDAERDKAFKAGMPYEIAGEDDVVQTRERDQTNLLGIAIEARELVAAGVTDAVIEFRGLSNVNRYLTPKQAVDLTNAASAHVKEVYARSWARKDAIDAAEKAGDRAAIEAVEW